MMMQATNQTTPLNLTWNSSYHYPPPEATPTLDIPLYMYILVTLFYVAILTFGTLGNLMVIIVVIKNVTMRNSTNVFLVNLSIADICVLVVCVPTALSEFYGKDVWYLGEAMCKYTDFYI